MISFNQVKSDSVIKTYIEYADKCLSTLGYTEHSFAHVGLVAHRTKYILDTLGYSEREIELGMIAAYMHDIGNLVNREGHSQIGALIAMRILEKLGMDTDELVKVVTAIGNHDEGTGQPVSELAAALILADKSDVRRNRVRDEQGSEKYDIHDRVNYSVTASSLKINSEKTAVRLDLTVDTNYSSIMEYFQIFMERMELCRQAATSLGLKFELFINKQQLV